MSDFPISMPVHGSRQLPSIYIREEDLPVIRSWEIDGEYYIIAKVKQVSVSKARSGDETDQARLESELQITSIKALDERPISIKDLEKAEMDAIYVRARSGNA